jgi:hypothetical protein
LATESEHIELELTPEQQSAIHRLSGQHAQVLRLTLDPGTPTEGAARVAQFRWRLSTASGIPRQHWDPAPGGPPEQ